MVKQERVSPEGYRGVTPESVGPGYVKPGAMSDELKGGINGGGEAQQSGLPCRDDRAYGHRE